MIATQCDYFDIEEVGAGIFAVIDKGEKIAGSNAGIIDCGDICVVFDTLLNLAASRELVKKCLELTGKNASIIINSHSHIDHFHGNAVFGNSPVIVTSEVNQQSIVRQQKWYQTREIPTEQELAALKNKTLQGSAIERLNAKNEYLFSSCLSAPGNDLKPPTLVFTDHIQINGQERKVVVESIGKCHSEEDVVLRLDEDQVIFLGDVLFVGEHPWLGSGNPLNLLNYFRKLLDQPYLKYVPGHGGVGNRADLEAQIEYLEIIIDHLRSRANGNTKPLALADLPAQFSQWDPLCFQWNLDSAPLAALIAAAGQ